MSNIIQVSNIAATVTDENIKTLFGFVGSIRETIIYFEDSQQEETKVAYIVYESNSDAETALHLHNTVFHDRALIVLPLADCCGGQIPDVNYAKVVRAPDKTVTGILPKSKSWPREVISMVVGRTGEQSIITIEPNFIKQGLPTYPKLPYSTEVAKIDEIRRTVLVTNLDPATNSQQVLDFFQSVAEVKFIRMAGSDSDNAAYVEFSEQSAIAKGFGMMGTNLNGRPIMVQHSNVAIVKPTNYLRGLEETGKRKKESGSVNGRSKSREKRKSKSRKPSRSRKESRSRKGSKSKKRSRSRKRSASRSRRRSRSKSHRKSNSRSRRSRSKNRKTKKRSRTRSKDRKRPSHSHEKRKDRSRSRHRKTKRRSKSKHDSPDSKKRKVREKSLEKPKESSKQRDKKHKLDRHKDDKKKKGSGSDTKDTKPKDKKKTDSGVVIKSEKVNGLDNQVSRGSEKDEHKHKSSRKSPDRDKSSRKPSERSSTFKSSPKLHAIEDSESSVVPTTLERTESEEVPKISQNSIKEEKHPSEYNESPSPAPTPGDVQQHSDMDRSPENDDHTHESQSSADNDDDMNQSTPDNDDTCEGGTPEHDNTSTRDGKMSMDCQSSDMECCDNGPNSNSVNELSYCQSTSDV